MNTEALKKVLYRNGIHFYSYWSKPKLLDLARINNLLPKPPKTKKSDIDENKPKYENYEHLKNIRNSPISVKLVDVETEEELTFPSIYKASQYIDKSPQTIRYFGKKKGIWNNKYKVIMD